jgi:hypothetical protein
MAEVQGVILEAGDGWALILLPGGEYKRIRTREQLQVGELYQYKKYSPVKYVAVAAIFLVVMVASLDFCRVTARAHVSPGINLGLNRWDKVVSVDTSNIRGQEIIKEVNVRGKSLEQVVNVLVEQQTAKACLSNESIPEFSVSLSVKDKQDKKRQEKLLSKVNSAIKNNMGKSNNRPGQVNIIRKGNQLIVVDDKQPFGSGKANKAKSENSEKKQGPDYKSDNSNSGKSNPGKAKSEQKVKQVINHPISAQPQGNQKNEIEQGEQPGKKINQEKFKQKQSPYKDNDKKIKNKDKGNNGKGIGSGKDKDKANKKS